MNNIEFVAGIDTGVGKTIITGLLAARYLTEGVNVITQKLAQTGCIGISDDILKHRELMGIDIQEVDRLGISCPYVFRHPASPHLSAALDGKTIDVNYIDQQTQILSKQYDKVLLEGVGGLYVPLTEEYTALDFLAARQYPVILVSSPRLGSINHTLLSLDAMARRGITLKTLIYNKYQTTDETIATDTLQILTKFVARYGYSTATVEVW